MSKRSKTRRESQSQKFNVVKDTCFRRSNANSAAKMQKQQARTVHLGFIRSSPLCGDADERYGD